MTTAATLDQRIDDALQHLVDTLPEMNWPAKFGRFAKSSQRPIVVPQSIEDGPDELTSSFNYNNKSARLERKPFRLLMYLWKKHLSGIRRVKLPYAKNAIWWQESEWPDNHFAAFAMHISRVNVALAKAGAPYAVYKRDVWIYFEGTATKSTAI